MDIVTIEQVKEHVEVDHALHDDLLTEKANAAEAAVKQYLDDESVALDPENPQVVEAVLQLTGVLYKYRDDPNMGGKIAHGFLPFSVTMLLYPLRDPGFA